MPLALREAVRQTSRQSWTYTEITYADDRAAVPGFAVGAPLALPDVGAYELYYLFPLSQEARTPSRWSSARSPSRASRWSCCSAGSPGW